VRKALKNPKFAALRDGPQLADSLQLRFQSRAAAVVKYPFDTALWGLEPDVWQLLFGSLQFVEFLLEDGITVDGIFRSQTLGGRALLVQVWQ
jgi:hypothetical protein